MADWQALRDWTRRSTGFELNEAHVDALRAYVDLLRLWNRRVSLVGSAEDVDLLLNKHLADSLFAAAHCRDASAIVDLGSGAGFPGLVIAMVCPGARVTLIEARGKKVSFLEEVCRVASLGNARPMHARIEVMAAEQDQRGAYDLATSRALGDLVLLRELSRPFLRPHGQLLAMRAASAAVPAGARRVDYTLPDGTPRTLLFEQRRPT
ncbi:16S rRNA (guanine(527)-N(7))-methyltransferase RsmG [bacterium]|nr:16S rRNA (guanine(527)-N(7))-methyltransferase RsmG [bacterium]